MLRIFLIICLAALIKIVSCTPARILLDPNTRDTPPSPQELTEGWDLWDTDGRQFSGRIPQFDVYHPAVGQLRNFGKYLAKMSDDLPSPSAESKPFRIWQPNCEDLDLNEVDLLSLIGAVRCRRTTREWMVPEPLYVKEPRWVPIDINQSDKSPTRPDDPFIIARGKRSAGHNEHVNSLKTTNSTRPKREILTDIELENFREVPRIGYVEPRDKHSDIMDILREPFFISRGKKSRSKKDELRAETNLSSGSSSNYRTARDRRGEIMEELLKAQDPFFIARGRRAINSF